MSDNEMTQNERIAFLEAKASELETICAYTLHALISSGGVPTRIRESVVNDISRFADGAETRVEFPADLKSAFRGIVDHLNRYEAIGLFER